jgi:hypothetical protein
VAGNRSIHKKTLHLFGPGVPAIMIAIPMRSWTSETTNQTAPQICRRLMCKNEALHVLFKAKAFDCLDFIKVTPSSILANQNLEYKGKRQIWSLVCCYQCRPCALWLYSTLSTSSSPYYHVACLANFLVIFCRVAICWHLKQQVNWYAVLLPA